MFVSNVYEVLFTAPQDFWWDTLLYLLLALDGQLKHEDTNLASSTLVPDQTNKENLGIIVQYKVGLSILSVHQSIYFIVRM